MAKLTRNSYKRKIILFGVFVFMSIALISTGFAAWVMSADDEVVEEGNVDVGIVKDSTIDIVLTNYDTEIKDFNFLFEPAVGDTKDNFLLGHESVEAGEVEGETVYVCKHCDLNKKDAENRVHLEEVEAPATAPTESLVLTIKGTITNPGNLAENGLTILMVLPEGIAQAVTNNYIVAPECLTEQVITPNENGEFTYTIEFKWGTKFGGMNPSIYYDCMGRTVSNQEVRETLENLRACVYNYYSDLTAEGADRDAVIAANASKEIPTFKITITATAK